MRDHNHRSKITHTRWAEAWLAPSRREPCQMTEYLTVQQVADLIHAEHRVVRKAIKRGDLRASFVGGRYLITEEAVDAWIESRAVRPSEPPVHRTPRAKPEPTAAAASVARMRAMGGR